MAVLKSKVKLQVPAGEATPAPPVGTALGPHGIKTADFVRDFNEQSMKIAQKGDVLPVIISIFDDRSFTFEIKTSPAAFLIKKTLKLAKGSAKPHKEKVGKITQKQLEEIATTKMVDLNANDVAAGIKIIAGTARSMGVDVEK